MLGIFGLEFWLACLEFWQSFCLRLLPLNGWFALFWVHRYLRTIVHTYSHWTYISVPIPAKPSFTSSDVTVIIPTIHNNFEELRESIQSILVCNPFELLLVTTSDKYAKLVAFTKTLEAPNVRVFQSPIANKRLQVCEAIPKAKTEFIIMADDDVTWPKTILPWLLAPFEDKKVGGVGPCQRVKRLTSGTVSELCYNWLGADYIERRNFEISATHGIDGGTSCMSGRTCCFRSEILQAPLFLEGFKTERWLKYHLNADDDNFVTRWLVANGWKTWIQYKPECEIETTLENNVKFLYQCSRWARSNWRSNWTSLVRERYVWKQQPWCTYALHIATFTSLSVAFDPWILYLAYKVAESAKPGYGWHGFFAQLAWIFLSKVIKRVHLFTKRPSDLKYLPVSIIFGYFHGFIKLYALTTLNMTSWGSRADGDANDNHRMTPRARRSESVTLPPGNHPTLVRFRGDKAYVNTTEKPIDHSADDNYSESDLDAHSDYSYDVYDSQTTSRTISHSNSMVALPHGR